MSAATAHGAATPSAALRSFEVQWRTRADAGPADPLTCLRAQAMQRVLALGLPTTRDETWRYTNLRRLAARGFEEAPRSARGDQGAAAARTPPGGDGHAATVLVVNGHPVLPASFDSRFKNIEIKSLKELSRTNPELLAALLGPVSDAELGRWGLLNTALFEDGLYLRICGQVDTPLVILHVLSSVAPGSIAHPAVIIDAAAESRATVIEHYVEQGSHSPLANSATRIAAGRGAQLEHYRVFATGAGADHIDTLTLRQHAGSRCRQFTVAVGGGLVRASLEADLREAGAALDSFALLVGHEARHVDCVNVVTHGARDTASKQTARAIASGSSRVIFNSKVVVSAGAEHAESRQSCRGLLLSPGAEIDTRPQLEIHADEVKCAHGATIGRLDADMLFYLLSRGIDRETAQSLLVYAFLADVLTGMSVATTRSAIENALIAQLPDSQLVDKFR
jgi:Fe-S cluster assembly protein SufD